MNFCLRSLTKPLVRQQIRPCLRQLHSSRRVSDGNLTNILAGGAALPLQIKNVSAAGIELEDGLILPSACIFLDGKVFLWDVPTTLWDGWGKQHFEIFETVVPKPGELL